MRGNPVSYTNTSNNSISRSTAVTYEFKSKHRTTKYHGNQITLTTRIRLSLLFSAEPLKNQSVVLSDHVPLHVKFSNL